MNDPTFDFAGVKWQAPLLVVSPHLDDAVLSVGNLLAAAPAASVATVFAGNPGNWSDLKGWDGDCGFGVGDDVVAARRSEDAAAGELLAFESIWLDFLDHQYAPNNRPSTDEIADALMEVITKSGAATVAAPMGIGHHDHRQTAEAAKRALGRLNHLEVMTFGDLPYMYRPEDVVEFQQKASDLAHKRSVPGSAASPEKRSGINCYPTQKQGLGELWKLALRPEAYWRGV